MRVRVPREDRLGDLLLVVLLDVAHVADGLLEELDGAVHASAAPQLQREELAHSSGVRSARAAAVQRTPEVQRGGIES